MGREIDLFEQPLEQVIFLQSPVVESMALLCAMTTNNQEFLSTELLQLQKLFPHELVIQQLRNFPENNVFELFNLLIPIPNLNSVEQFAEKLLHMKDEYFLYYFWSEEIPLETVQQLIINSASIWDMEPSYYWQTDESKEWYEQWIPTIAIFKENFAQLILKISQSAPFLHIQESRTQLMNDSMESLKQLSLEPLALAQYVMGKTFRRVSLYKMYYFIPCYSLTPVRIRIFNDSVCYVIYGCAKPLSDEREKSEQLTLQLKAIADPNRLLMLRMLATKKEYGAKLAEYLGITTATVSHHLEILKKAGLITEEKIGTIKYFAVEEEHVTNMVESLQRFTIGVSRK